MWLALLNLPIDENTNREPLICSYLIVKGKYSGLGLLGQLKKNS